MNDERKLEKSVQEKMEKKLDFRDEIEKRYNRSIINKIFTFPR